MSQVDLAKASGYVPSYIVAIERGERLNPSRKCLKRIARVLRVTVAELDPDDEGDDDEPEPEPDAGLLGSLLSEDDIGTVEDEHFRQIQAAWPHLGGPDREELAQTAKMKAAKSVQGMSYWRQTGRDSRSVVDLGQVFDLGRGAEASISAIHPADAPDSILRSGERWVPCVVPADVRPGWVATSTHKLAQNPAERASKASQLHESAGPAVVVEPRVLMAGVVDPRRSIPRSLVWIAPKPGTTLETEPVTLCERAALLMCSDIWPATMPEIKFFNKSVVPTVTALSKVPWPLELGRDTERTRELDQVCLRMVRWARGLRPDSQLKTFDQQLGWRSMNPERKRINDLVNSIMSEV